MVLVTGGTGLVGSHLLLKLLEQGVKVRAIHRVESDLSRVEKIFSYYDSPSSKFFDKIEWVVADINTIPDLEKAFEGVSQVYHCAALISFDPNDYEQLHKVNVEGTANIVNLCISNNIEKLCYVSSIAAIGKSIDNHEATEENDWYQPHASVYSITKTAAELEVWRGSQENVPVVIINPGIILGPGFWKSGSGTLFQRASKAPKYFPPGGSGFIAVSDVVNIMTNLMKSDTQNERFIVISKNLSYQEILQKLTHAIKKDPPNKQIPFWTLEILWRLDWFWCLIANRKRQVTSASVYSLKNREFYSNTKLVERLDYTFASLEETILFSTKIFNEEHPVP
ncbi:NAD-dependent epimerase/dehydratase family protein [Sediminicola arcticus]|jgi:dihydroflavonol-4-reductase|uniref:NAD-dependent epimerase/dehydratase family protein n=1 Tax=Sediminicola arcticus TaxID=1574308 RepID=A0ABV2SR52_9FLAO